MHTVHFCATDLIEIRAGGRIYQYRRQASGVWFLESTREDPTY